MARPLDPTLQLETIYYSAPVPRDLGVLNLLGLVFDRVHFPRVHLPVDGYSRRDLDAEITRIKSLQISRDYRTSTMLSVLEFTRHTKTLEGFCVFEPTWRDAMMPEGAALLVKDLTLAINGPLKPGFELIYEKNHMKAIGGSDTGLVYQDGVQYMAAALLRSTELGVPLFNDVAQLPVPGVAGHDVDRDAEALAALLAMQSVLVALPGLPLLSPERLMDFRDENAGPLRAFRRSMLAFTGEVSSEVRGATNTEEITQRLTFFVKRRIVPELDQLRELIEAPARPWHQRVGGFMTGLVQLGVGLFAAQNAHPAMAALSAFAPQVITELSAGGDKQAALKRSGLYYLLKRQRFSA